VRWAVEEPDGLGVDRSVDAEYGDLSNWSLTTAIHPSLRVVGDGVGTVVHVVKRHGASRWEQQPVDALTELPSEFLEWEVCGWYGDVAFQTSIMSRSHGDLVLVSLVGIVECS